MSNINYQAIVVGAGPSGSSATYFLGKFGIRTLLLDKAEFPRSKLCSGGITPRSLSVLDEMQFSPKIEAYQRILGTKIIAPDGRVVEGLIPKTSRYRNYGYVVPRVSLDKMLRDHAVKAESVDFSQAEVVDLLFDREKIVGVSVKNGEKIYSNVVILANGANSHLTQKHGLIKHSPDRCMMALESWFDNMQTDDKILIYFQKDILPGYFWIFPEGNGRANVGLGISDLPNYHGPKFVDLFRNILAQDNVKRLMRGATLTHPPRSWPIRSRDPTKIAIGNGVLAVGDSGGFANQFTGEGIYYALESGKFAALAVKDAVQKADFSHKGLNLFERLCHGEFKEDITTSNGIKDIFGDEKLVNQILHQASQDSELNSVLQGVIVNVLPKKELFRFINGPR